MRRNQKHWSASPKGAWNTYLREVSRTTGWVEKGRPKVSENIPLLYRELFALIILGHFLNEGKAGNWRVSYDGSTFKQPYDGHVANKQNVIAVEHKLVAQKQKESVVQAMEELAVKYTDKVGRDYGKGRTLIIQPNKAPNHPGLIHATAPSHAIRDIDVSFDRVLTLTVGKYLDESMRKVEIALIEQYPQIGMARMHFDLDTGKGNITYNKIDWL